MMFILGGRLSFIAKYRFPLPERAKNNFNDVHKDEDDDEVSTIGFFFISSLYNFRLGTNVNNLI